ncbi:hypothetical protein SGUI_3153 [Serinicoccus hydrothermalis]|uniref:Uncharacterized protein n=1 Tax=Serinicoccus hydrothermalis TaxID=1758689 RepID=A0A1B1NGK9_9MICO|nr:hypothetical protein SGUI_3153 [Serinicoccus hydrothermalis]
MTEMGVGLNLRIGEVVSGLRRLDEFSNAGIRESGHVVRHLEGHVRPPLG